MRRPPLLLVAASVVAVAVVSGCSASGSAAAKDVRITGCTAGPSGGGHPTATGRILNHSSQASLYMIHVQFIDSAGNDAGDGVAAVAKVGPNTMAAWGADGTVDAKGPVKCKVSDVTRDLSPTG